VVVKSEKRGDMLDDLKETFNNLCKYKMMLNPKKMYTQCIIWQTARLHGIGSGDRHKSEEGGGHLTIATTSNPKRNTEAGRHDGSTQLVYIQIM
jgi:hypothetical protein